MTERMLVTKLTYHRQSNRVDLIGRGHRYKDFTLFDPSDLLTVGLDPETLEPGVEVTCRFWVLYELSEKTNKAGNPYKDIVALEPTDRPATSTSVDTSAIVDELRKIKAILQQIAGGLNTAPAYPAPDPDPYPAGSPTSDAEPDYSHVEKLLHREAEPAPQVDNGQGAYQDLAARAQVDGIPIGVIDSITYAIGNPHGWTLAAQCLAAEMQRRDEPKADYRKALIARMWVILGHQLVKTKLVQSQIEPGWNFLWTNAQIKAEGKRLVTAIKAEGGEV